MAWGLYNQARHSAKYPQGELVGWYEKLDEYFETHLKGQQDKWELASSYRYHVACKSRFDKGILLDHEKPREYYLSKNYKKLADFISIRNGFYAVKDNLKDIIEELEPDVHQFWPIKFISCEKKEIDDKFYGIIIRNYVDSAIPEKSDWDEKHSTIGIYYSTTTNNNDKYCGKLYLNKKKINNKHLWRELKWISPSIFISNELNSRMEKEQITTFNKFKAEEV